jgi:hypothetical protein
MAFCNLLAKYSSVDTSYGTDKNTSHSYGPVYDTLFAPYKDTATQLLEIGFDSGASLQVYSEYFTNATIYGIDICDNCQPQYKQNPRIRMHFGDANASESVQGFEGPFDIIVEDASHTLPDQIQHFKDYSSKVKKGGLYIIEDVHENNLANLNSALNMYAVQNGFSAEIMDLRHVKGRFDDILFVFRRV